MRVVTFLIVAMLCACSGPLLIIPGGRLDGAVSATPAEWTSVGQVDALQVEFTAADPYSINIWGVGIGPDLYIATSADGTRWTKRLASDPNVRVRVGNALYELTATAVTDSAERERVLAAYKRKYDVKDDSFVATGKVFRLDRRAAQTSPAPAT